MSTHFDKNFLTPDLALCQPSSCHAKWNFDFEQISMCVSLSRWGWPWPSIGVHPMGVSAWEGSGGGAFGS